MNVTPGAGADKVTTASPKDKINLANGGADTDRSGKGNDRFSG